MIAHQMLAVGVGWQIYTLTGSALDLGLRRTRAVPAVVPPRARRRPRRRPLRPSPRAAACMVVEACGGSWASPSQAHSACITEHAIFALIFVVGAARAFQMPTMQALLPALVPRALLSRAIAANASASQTAIIAGPALGGIIYVAGPAAVYGVSDGAVPADRPDDLPDPHGAAACAVRHAPTCRRCSQASASSAASRRCSARSRSTCSPCCSAVRRRCCRSTRATSCTRARGASACCARARRSARSRMALWLARHPLRGHAGRKMFAAVAVFGAATIVFGVSTIVRRFRSSR